MINNQPCLGKGDLMYTELVRNEKMFAFVSKTTFSLLIH